MRPGQSNKRSRGRGRKGPSPLSRSHESNGPDVKIRGTAQHIADKYINLARDAQSSGDTVLAEAYLQHAEHYYRIVATAQQQMNQPVNVRRADDPIDTEENEAKSEFDPSDPDAPQPEASGNGRDDDGEGERRSRRNRGRQRRGRGDEARGGEGRQGQDGARQDEAVHDASGANGHGLGAEAAQSESGPSNGLSESPSALENGPGNNASSDADADADRSAPRVKRAEVDVTDSYDEPASSPVESDGPKPVTFGDDGAQVRAAPEDD